jgi:hypothetical protein
VHIRVDSYAGHHGVETPQRLRFDSREVDVVENLDQWDGPNYRYFKLQGDDGNIYILRSDDVGADWELVMFQSPRASSPLAQLADKTPTSKIM